MVIHEFVFYEQTPVTENIGDRPVESKISVGGSGTAPVDASEITFRSVKNSDLVAHQVVHRGGAVIGEIWSERARVVVSKPHAPAKWDLRVRWFARVPGQPGVLGRGTRPAMIFGPGFPTKQAVLAQLVRATHPHQASTALT